MDDDTPRGHPGFEPDPDPQDPQDQNAPLKEVTAGMEDALELNDLDNVVERFLDAPIVFLSKDGKKMPITKSILEKAVINSRDEPLTVRNFLAHYLMHFLHNTEKDADGKPHKSKDVVMACRKLTQFLSALQSAEDDGLSGKRYLQKICKNGDRTLYLITDVIRNVPDEAPMLYGLGKETYFAATWRFVVEKFNETIAISINGSRHITR